mmetsp:Transcript_1692/g.4616  ORF Transcript_1692/g.4616 Transcript_1692/m.4616 type:complete len:205 (+) Transcript_1692:91-705(+)
MGLARIFRACGDHPRKITACHRLPDSRPGLLDSESYCHRGLHVIVFPTDDLRESLTPSVQTFRQTGIEMRVRETGLMCGPKWIPWRWRAGHSPGYSPLPHLTGTERAGTGAVERVRPRNRPHTCCTSCSPHSLRTYTAPPRLRELCSDCTRRCEQTARHWTTGATCWSPPPRHTAQGSPRQTPRGATPLVERLRCPARCLAERK